MEKPKTKTHIPSHDLYYLPAKCKIQVFVQQYTEMPFPNIFSTERAVPQEPQLLFIPAQGGDLGAHTGSHCIQFPLTMMSVLHLCNRVSRYSERKQESLLGSSAKKKLRGSRKGTSSI